MIRHTRLHTVTARLGYHSSSVVLPPDESLTSLFFFFFSSRRRHTRSLCDWSSDVCSSDLRVDPGPVIAAVDLEPDVQAAAGQRLGRVEIVENHAQRHTVPRDALHVWNVRSEERRVGKECRSRWAASQERKSRRETRASSAS